MNEETISKVLTGETDIAKMSHDDFVEMLKCLGRMYFSRVMNCVDGTGKSDKEWTALSCIFSRVVEAITEKPSGNSAALREALKTVKRYFDGYTVNVPEMRRQVDAALAAPPRNCDVGTAEEQAQRFHQFCMARQSPNTGVCVLTCPCGGLPDKCHCMAKWAQMPYKEGGAT